MEHLPPEMLDKIVQLLSMCGVHNLCCVSHKYNAFLTYEKNKRYRQGYTRKQIDMIAAGFCKYCILGDLAVYANILGMCAKCYNKQVKSKVRKKTYALMCEKTFEAPGLGNPCIYMCGSMSCEGKFCSRGQFFSAKGNSGLTLMSNEPLKYMLSKYKRNSLKTTICSYCREKNILPFANGMCINCACKPIFSHESYVTNTTGRMRSVCAKCGCSGFYFAHKKGKIVRHVDGLEYHESCLPVPFVQKDIIKYSIF